MRLTPSIVALLVTATSLLAQDLPTLAQAALWLKAVNGHLVSQRADLGKETVTNPTRPSGIGAFGMDYGRQAAREPFGLGTLVRSERS